MDSGFFAGILLLFTVVYLCSLPLNYFRFYVAFLFFCFGKNFPGRRVFIYLFMRNKKLIKIIY